MEKKETLNKDIYNEFVQNVNIESINLAELSIKNLNMDTDGKGQLAVNLEFQNNKYNLMGDNLRVNPKFILNTSKLENENEVIVFKIEFEYDLDYSIKSNGNIQKEYIELFVKRNVPINIWPYARELISSMTTRMGYPALIIEPLKG